MQASTALCSPEHWGSALLWWTGSAAHRAALQTLLDGSGTLTAQGLNNQGLADETAAYHALGLPWIAPELREGWGEVALAHANRLPTLIDIDDIRADLHWHTQWSDGRGTLEAMVEAGQARGYTHMSVADHSAYLGVTGGLKPKQLREQRKAIEALNSEFEAQGIAFRLLQCCEVDILPDGSLALPDEALAGLDIVVASPHVALRQDRESATARLIRAINNPYVDIIGHPTGRLLEERQGLDLDMDQVIAAAAKTDTALEVNAGPERLDLDAPLIRQALQAGVKLSINTDAHDPRHLAGIGLGVLTARRGGAQAIDVINTWNLEALIEWKQTRRP
jgi:DNA polymerase (family 10)